MSSKINIKALTTIVASTYNTSNDFASTVFINSVEFYYDSIFTKEIPVEKLTVSHLLQLTAKSDIHEARRLLFESYGSALGCRNNFAAFLQKSLFISIVALTPCNTNIVPRGAVTSDEGAVYSKTTDKAQAQIAKVFKKLGIDGKFKSIKPALQLDNYYYQVSIGSVNKTLSDATLQELKQAVAMGELTIIADDEKGIINIQIPKTERQYLPFNEDNINDTNNVLPVFLGKDTDGEFKTIDLSECPHLLIGGQTGGGKSVLLNVIINSLLVKTNSADVKMMFFDPKYVELRAYKGLEDRIFQVPDKQYTCLLTGATITEIEMPAVITEFEEANHATEYLIQEMSERYRLLSKNNCKNIKTANAKGIKMPYIVVIIDEYGDLANAAKRFKKPEFVNNLIKLAQQGRAAGIHIILTTQRPSATIINSDIKAQFPVAISAKTNSAINSRIILDTNGAEALQGKGDIYLSFGNDLVRIQSPMIDDETIDINIKKDNFKKELF